MIKIIQKHDIKQLLKHISGEWEIFAPQKTSGGDIWIEPLPRDKDTLQNAIENKLVLENADTVISPKDIFFPQLETLFTVKDGEIKETAESSKKLLFGVSACDLNGILFTDAFFKRNFEDIYYLSRIKDRFIIVTACNSPPRKDSCFCTSANTGPYALSFFDLQLFDFGGSFFVETGSEYGERFIKKYNNFFGDADKNADIALDSIKKKAYDAVELKVDFKKALALMSRDDYIPEENYRRIGERCIYCGGCLYVCPTCACFNIFDNFNNKDGERVRIWDACIFEGYTREASGHNPRKEKWIRTSRRYEHKLKYDFKTTGTSGCVGCGRCLASCPVGIGISKFIQEITEGKTMV